MMSFAYRTLAFAVASLTSLSLTACGGGGGAGGSALPSTSAAQPVSASAPVTSLPPAVQSAPVQLNIVIPLTGASVSRRVQFISSATKSAVITVTPAFGSAITNTVNCSAGGCNTTMQAPVGRDIFAISLYDGPNGTGNVLSAGSAVSQIVASGANTVNITFSGVVASVALSYNAASVVAGTAATIALTVSAKDAQGNVIVGPDSYTTPITLSNSDTSGVTRLSTTSVTSPASAATVAYNGGTVSAATITASAGSSTSSIVINATAANTAVGVVIPIPTAAPANVPAHVLTYLYYGASFVNANLPAAFVAAHADFAEMSESQTNLSAAFKAAGGRFAVVYSDPTYQPHCVAPFTPPAGLCSGPIATYIATEAGYDHAADGSRVRKANGSDFQEALNLGSVEAQGAYRQFTQTIAAGAQNDFFFADDSGSTYTNGGGDPMTGLFYGFSAPAVEVTSDAQYQAQEKAMLASSVRPVIVNGNDQATWLPAYNGAFLNAPNVAGENHEGCFNWFLGLQTDTNTYWQRNANSLLANTAAGRYAICMMMGTASPANRLYQMASWWLTYDAAWSVAAPVATAADGYAVFPEYDIVPRTPKQSATSDIAALRTSASGAYVREFANCYQAGASIGACAAVVNTSGSSVAMPSLGSSYARSLVLNDASSYTSGTASWTGGVPTSLPPASAVVLRQ